MFGSARFLGPRRVALELEVPEPAAQEGVTLDVAGLKGRMAAGELPACEAKLELAAEKWHCEVGRV